MRYRLLSDDCGHKYTIPVGREKDFYLWVESLLGENDTYKGENFTRYRVDGRLTFADPRTD